MDNYGSNNSAGGGGNKKLHQTQAQVNEVVDIMRQNVESVIDRDVKLSELDHRAGALQAGATQFETQASQLKRKYWWKNMKMWLILGGVGLLLFIILVWHFKSKDVPSTEPVAPNSAAAAKTGSDTNDSDKSGAARRRRNVFELGADINEMANFF